MRFLLIPLDHASPAVAAYLARQPGESEPLSDTDQRELARLAARFAVVADAMVMHAKALSGRPSAN